MASESGKSRHSRFEDTFLRSIECLTIVVLVAFCAIQQTGAIQCYSCRATASNEIEANINCLETANLEDCNDFYEYYSEVENGHEIATTSSTDDYDFPVPDKKTTSMSTVSASGTTTKSRVKRQSNRSKKKEEVDADYDYNSDYQYGEHGSKSRNGSDSGSGRKMSLPTDPEHNCYSITKKNAWESYTVEKGCKKVSYCRAHEESMPAEWSLAWNFCCDKSRCNAKLVKDKPQRIFAMGCRRTDDCIQGHTTRHVCPEMFNTCPKISTNVIKMECRVRGKGNAPSASKSVAYGNNYFNQFKEKKCFCAKGFYPRGPICSGAVDGRLHTSTRVSIALLIFSLTSFLSRAVIV